MEITRELFVLPYKKNYILYAPLEGTVMEVEGGVVNYLQQIQTGANPEKLDGHLFQELSKRRILVEKQRPAPTRKIRDYAPTSVTLLPTYGCNLRCVYCYARGGEDVGNVMSEEVARAAIDFIINNAIKTKQDNVSLGFHGGGEPLLPGNMNLIKNTVEYLKSETKKNNLKPSINSASNGVFSEETLEWIINNINHLALSLDGPEDIQNSQRPMVGNLPSFQRVLTTIKRLESLTDEEKKRFNYGLRATITAQSVKRMPEIVEFFSSISSNKSFHLEPLFECGRCRTTSASSPDPSLFLENIIKASKLADKLGRAIYYSGAEIEKIGQTFCGACGSNFFVNPEGDVTACVEACRRTEKISDIFFIGGYDPKSKGFSFDEKRRDVLTKRTVLDIPHCEKCFAKYNCAGDCPAKVLEQSGSLNDPSNNWRCQINRGLLKHRFGLRFDAEESKTLKIAQKKDENKGC